MNDKNNKIVPNYSFTLPPENSICKVDLSGFLIDDFKTFNPEGYTILCRVGETCNGLQYFPDTSTIILDHEQQSKLFQNFQELIPGLAKDLQITQEEALQKSYHFFSNTIVRVEPQGIQGKAYNTMKNLQNYVPISYTMKALSASKTMGIKGMNVIVGAPLTFVGATYIGAIFFGYAGVVAGNNPVGSVFNATSYVLSRPMRFVEITLNGVILRPVSQVIGLPLVLNGTQELLNGNGLSVEEFSKIGTAFDRICNSTLVKKAKDIYKILRS